MHNLSISKTFSVTERVQFTFTAASQSSEFWHALAAVAALSIAALAAAQTKELELRVMTFNARNEGDRGRNAWVNRRPLVAR